MDDVEALGALEFPKVDLVTADKVAIEFSRDSEFPS